jgi:hypothetical protein
MFLYLHLTHALEVRFTKWSRFVRVEGFETICNVCIHIIELGHTLYAEAMPVCS